MRSRLIQLRNWRPSKAVMMRLCAGALCFFQVATPALVQQSYYRAGLTAFMVAAQGLTFGGLALRSALAEATPEDDELPPLTEEQQLWQDEGRSLVPDAGSLGSVDGAGNMTLWPSSDASYSLSQEELFQTAPGDEYVDPKTVEGDHHAILNLADDVSGELSAESETGATTTRGDAFRILQNSNAHAHPDLTNDPIITSSQSIRDNEAVLFDSFANCSATTITHSGETTNHLPEYEYCERVAAGQGTYTLYHDYSVTFPVEITGRGASHTSPDGTVTRIDAFTQSDSCGYGCVDVYIGKSSNNYWSGHCDVFSQYIDMRVPVPAAITSAKLRYVEYDDFARVFVAGVPAWTGPSSFFPPVDGPDDNNCERDKSHDVDLNINVTSILRANEDVRFELQVSVGGEGEGYAILRVNYDPKLLIQDNGYFPAAAVDAAQLLGDDQCPSGAAVPTSSPTVDSAGCATVNGVPICPGDFSTTPPSDGIDPMWYESEISANCNPTYGTYCWVDMQGEEQCYTQTPENTDGDNCSALEATPECAYLGRECLEGAMGDGGHCYVYEETWDCGYDVSTPTYSSSEVTTCEGQIQCVGESCIRQDYEAGDDFAHAVAAMTAVNGIATDSECTPDGDCRVFPGTDYFCKKAVGGLQNCCEGPAAPSLTEYIAMYVAANRVGAAVANLDAMQPLMGAWESLYNQASTQFSNYWSAVKEPFASVLDSVSGAGVDAATDVVADTAADGAMATFLDEVKQKLMAKAYDLLEQRFGEDVASAFIEKGTESAAAEYALSDGATAVVNAASFIMAAYTAYVIAMALIAIVWACEPEELEMTVKEELKLCHKVGAYCADKLLGACIEKREVYCCYNSPLSRIVMEQINEQTGQSYGSPKDPICDGIAIQELAEIDFSRIDLSEWVAILSITGNLPSEGESVETDFSLEKMTGADSELDTAGYGPNAEDDVPRMNTEERTRERLQASEPDTSRNNTRDFFWNGDEEGAEAPADGDTGTYEPEESPYGWEDLPAIHNGGIPPEDP